MPPGSVTTGSGGQYKIYTPFMRALWRSICRRMIPCLRRQKLLRRTNGRRVTSSKTGGCCRPSPTGQGVWLTCGSPGEAGARERLDEFTDKAKLYDEKRNLPSVDGTSFLSPHLHFGEISPATCWHATMKAGGSVDVFLKELVWRDYAQNVICQFPEYGGKNARDAFDKLPWRDWATRPRLILHAWTKGSDRLSDRRCRNARSFGQQAGCTTGSA